MAFFKLEPKIFRTLLIILLLHLGFIFQGCAILEYLDGSSKEEIRSFRRPEEDSPKEEIRSFKKTGEEIANDMEILRAENLRLKNKINTLEKLSDENLNEITKMKDQHDSLHNQIDDLQQETQRVQDKNKILSQKLAMLQLKAEKDIRRLKIKVLSGDGDLSSAKEMARKLRNMGYVIQFIHRAPRSNFLQDTVYFAPKFEDEAKSLASGLGSDAICKPLTWFSIFDLIVVTTKH